jgi:phosphoserine phosphatase
LDIILDDWCEHNNIKVITIVIDLESKLYIGNDCNFDENVLAYGDSTGDNSMLEIADFKFYRSFNKLKLCDL